MSRPEIHLVRLRDAALAAVLLYAAACNFAAFRDYHFEDAYITFRYAANLAAGEGFVFNPGERVLGTSTPLWTLLLAALAALGLDVVATAGFLYALCLSLCGGLGARLLGRRGYPNAGAAFALAAVWGVGGTLFYFGMETALYLALIFLSLDAAERDRPWVTGALLGLVATTRYDGVVVAAAVALDRFRRTGRPPWREAAVCGAVAGGWLLFAQLYFGSPLPNSLDAKTADVGFLAYLSSAAGQYRFLYTPLQRLWMPRDFHPIALQLVTALLVLPAILRSPRLLRRPGLRALPAIALLLVLGYAAIGPPPAHRWYLLPALYCLLAFVLAAWGESLDLRRRRWIAPAAVLAAIAASFAALPAGARHEAQRLRDNPTQKARVESYDLLVAWMRDHDLAAATLFTHEPGYLSYQTRQPVVDGAGLVTRGLFFHGPKERRSSLRQVADAYRPELMILGTSTGVPDPEIRGSYVPVYQAQPRKLLLLRRSAFERRFERLYATWRQPFYHPGSEPTIRHPIAVDFETFPTPGWNHSRGNDFYVGRPLADLRFRRRPVADRYLHTWSGKRGKTGTLWSDPFRIDFDELAFRFAASHPTRTVAQLFVGGLLTLEVGGLSAGGGLSADGGKTAAGGPPEMRQVAWPVHAFRGKVGVLRFVDADHGRGFVAADRVESRRYESLTLYDDFDSGGYGERWRQRFADAPAASRELARKYGLELALGSHVATSLGWPGTGALVSQPFAIARDRMAFVVCDFGGPETAVELRVDGRAVRRFAGRGRRRLAAVKWDLAPWRGRQAVLAVIDGDEDPERGIGVDAIVFFDRARP